MLEGQRILVTGATGQVARPIAQALIQRNQVWAAARFTDTNAKAVLEAQGIKTVVYTLGEEDLTYLPDVDYVFHCAANTQPLTTDAGIQDNAEGSGFLMKRYRDAKGFFYMSSDAVYRQQEDARSVITEASELGGYSAYARHYAMSKLVAEGVVRYMARDLKLPTVIARLDVAYGLEGHGGIPTVLYQFMKGKGVYTCNENSESFCCPIFEDDIVEQVQRLILKATVPATVVNLGGDDVVSIEEMIRYLETLTGLTLQKKSGPMASWQVRIVDSTLRKELSGPCKVHWKDGIRRILEHRFPDSLIDPLP